MPLEPGDTEINSHYVCTCLHMSAHVFPLTCPRLGTHSNSTHNGKINIILECLHTNTVMGYIYQKNTKHCQFVTPSSLAERRSTFFKLHPVLLIHGYSGSANTDRGRKTTILSIIGIKEHNYVGKSTFGTL